MKSKVQMTLSRSATLTRVISIARIAILGQPKVVSVSFFSAPAGIGGPFAALGIPPSIRHWER